MRFTCPSCSSSYRLSADRLGASGQAKIKCPKCATMVRVKVTPDQKLEATVYQPSGAFAPAQVGAAQVSAPAAKQAPSAARATQPRQAGDGGGTAAKPAAAKASESPADDGKIWHVAIGRDAKGPLTVAELSQLLTDGTITSANLVWRKGQDGWIKMSEVSALAAVGQPETGSQSASGGQSTASGKSGAAGNAASRRQEPDAEIKTTLKTGAASIPNSDEDATVLQDVITDEQLGRTGADDDSPTMMADVLPTELGSKPKAATGGAPRRLNSTRGSAASGGNAGNAAAKPVQAAVDASEARTLKPARRKQVDAAKSKLPNRREANAKAAAAAKPAGKSQSGATKPARVDKSAAKTKAARAKTEAPKPAKASSAKAGAKPAGGIAQSAAFFETGEQLNADFELQMPDVNKHKPTKEEYQNLLQEFSVMFRLDQRSKRQKWLLTTVLAGMLVGVIGFGVMLYLRGEQRKSLLRDSKTILAVFALPYQNSADFDVTPDEEVAEGSAIKRKKKTVSTLASSLLTKNKKRIVAARAQRKATKSGAVRGGGYIAKRKLTKEEREMAEARRKAAIAATLGGGYGGKQERVIRAGVGSAGTVTKAQLRKACSAKLPRLKGCGESHAGGSGFNAKLHVGDSGTIDRVDCRVGGKRNAKLSTCATAAFSRVNFGHQKSSTTFTCAVGGS